MGANTQTTDRDGWITIKPKTRKGHQQTSAALLAHCDENAANANASATPTSSVSIERLSERFSKVYNDFKSSSCCASLREILSRTSAPTNCRCVCLALGSLSEARTRVAPLHQLSALLIILEVLGIERTIAYDPVFTDVDKALLGRYSITPVSAEEINGGKEGSVFLFLPHGSLKLNYEYMRLKPAVYVGNSFDIYSLRITDEDRIKEYPLLDDFEKEYSRWGFPESESYHDGSVFNDMAIYFRKV